MRDHPIVQAVAHPHEIVRELATYRLKRELSFAALAREMRLAGFATLPRTLHAILTGRLRRAPRDTTLYRFKMFLATTYPTAIPRPTRRKRTRRGRSTAA